jgi:hypothetical protein
MRASVTGDSPSSTGRSLVFLGSRDAAPECSTRFYHQRPSAAFLAQLVATAQSAPQTRARRRATAGDAAARYAAAAASVTRPGVIRISL